MVVNLLGMNGERKQLNLTFFLRLRLEEGVEGVGVFSNGHLVAATAAVHMKPVVGGFVVSRFCEILCFEVKVSQLMAAQLVLTST